MSNQSWLSRLFRKGSRAAEPPPFPLSPGVHSDDAEYREHRDRGLRELKAGHVEEAMKALGHAVHLRPDLAEAHLNMGRAFQRAGKIEAARRAHQRALENDATCAEARSALAALPAPPPERKDFQVGQTLRSSTSGSTYKVLEVKKGGFGAVYVVQREESGGLYALKTFQARYLWSDEDRERFEREAVTWVMLDRHPNVVAAHWAERIEGFPCLVLEYVPGGDLAQLLQKGPLPVKRALELALQFCDGMAYAHGKLGIVHRDVKPSNCLLTEDGTLKVTDFGLARAFREAQEELLGLSGLGVEVKTQYTTPAGTPQYMAPEQFRAGVQLDTRTDIYAFGVMLYQMLTGDLPLVGSAAQAHIQANAATYRLPEDLLRLILWCVEPDSGSRPADFEEARRAVGTVCLTMVGRPSPAPAEPSAMGAAEWMDKGVALAALGRGKEALACFERGLEIEPCDSGLWNDKGMALHELGRHEEALACVERALQINPQDSRCWKNKGAVLYDLGCYEEALACHDKGLSIDSSDSGLWLSKGRALHRLGRYQEAVGCCSRGLDIAPRDSVLWQNKAVALFRLDRHWEALDCCDRALEIVPRDTAVWQIKALALRAVGRQEQALACYDRALEIDPYDSRLWRHKGAVLHWLRRYEEALDCYDRALEIDPCDSSLWMNKGGVMEALGRTQEAEECFRRAQELGGG
jgi:tetratricopeptide (TPR) repeat protein